MPTDTHLLDDATGTMPADHGFRMPPEWAPHQCTWLSWPHNTDTWPERRLRSVERALREAVRVLMTAEAVRINVLDEAHEARVRERLGSTGDAHSVCYHHIPTDDAWCRDHGATFVTRDGAVPDLAAIDWTYNAWGGKYPPYDRDAAVARRMADALDVPCAAPSLVAEGGAFEVNDHGVLLTTTGCLPNANRNPNRTPDDIAAVLRGMLGVETVCWLDGVELAGDDTDGHIDNLVRFGPDDVVLIATEDDPSDPNFGPLQTLRMQIDCLAAKRDWIVMPLPLPDPVGHENTRLPASYANFYVGTDAVLVPCFDDPADERAQSILAEVFPGRDIVGIDATDMVWGLGTLHCLTQQVPSGRSNINPFPSTNTSS